MTELRDEAVLAYREPPGTLPGWTRLVIACACAATVALPLIGCRVLWYQTDIDIPYSPLAFQDGLAAIAAVWLIATFVPRWRLPRLLRVAVLLPVVHIIVIAIAWPLWRVVEPHLIDKDRTLAIATATPLPTIALALAAVTAVAAVAIAWRRRDTGWTQAYAMIGLALLLGLGLWLPIASRIACSGSSNARIDPALALDHPYALAKLVVIPPLGAAIAFAAIAIRRPAWMREHRAALIIFLFIAFMSAALLRLGAAPADAVVYANFIPMLLAAALVACTGLISILVGAGLRARSLRRRIATGTWRGTVVSDDDPVVAAIEIAGWLRAPRLLVRPFIISTSAGELPVPGARLIAPMPASTTALRTGEAAGVLRAGDMVDVASLHHAPGSNPFRTLATPIAGEDVVVAPSALPPPRFASIALAAWRPAVAYLVILVALAVPALAASLASLDP